MILFAGRRLAVVLAATILIVIAAYAASPWGPSRSRGDATPVTLGTGHPGGIYHEYGRQLAERAPAGGLTALRTTVTGGSQDNVERLRRGQDTFGFATADVAAAWAGTGPAPIRAVARLHDNYLHLIVRADAPVYRPRDLRGLTVSVGAPGTGTALLADRVLAAAGLHPERDINRVTYDLDTAIARLRATCTVDCVDALFLSDGLASPDVLRIAQATAVRLVDLGGVAAQVRRDHGAVYQVRDVPAGTYTWLQSPIVTVAVPTLLLTTEGVAEGIVRRITALIFDTATDISAAGLPVSRSVSQIDRHSAIFTGAVPLHDGARAYYRETKIAA